MTRKCKMCNKDFTTFPCEVKIGRGKFCSQKCVWEWNSKNRIGENSPRWSGGRVSVICRNCGSTFKTYPSRIKSGYGLFCSKGCYGAWQSGNKKGENSNTWKGGEIERNCEICGGKFVRDVWTVKHGRTRFCSTKCQGVWSSKNKRGDKSPRWKGGITPDVRTIRTCKKYNEWRTRVFKRDNYECVKCGITGYVHAHHVKRFSIIINDIKQKFPLLSVLDIVENYPRLWDTSNGVTLCEKCHKEEHKRRK